MDILEKVQQFADEAHGDQKRKYSGEPYIVHPVRVMNICAQYTKETTVLSAALLHDVLEDTPVNKATICRFLEELMDREKAAQVIMLVTALTDVYRKENFPRLNRRRRKIKETERLKNVPGDAQTIKYADIMDNTNDITQYDPELAPVYLRECMNLLNNMTNGNPELCSVAKEFVQENLAKLCSSGLGKCM